MPSYLNMSIRTCRTQEGHTETLEDERAPIRWFELEACSHKALVHGPYVCQRKALAAYQLCLTLRPCSEPWEVNLQAVSRQGLV